MTDRKLTLRRQVSAPLESIPTNFSVPKLERASSFTTSLGKQSNVGVLLQNIQDWIGDKEGLDLLVDSFLDRKRDSEIRNASEEVLVRVLAQKLAISSDEPLLPVIVRQASRDLIETLEEKVKNGEVTEPSDEINPFIIDWDDWEQMLKDADVADEEYEKKMEKARKTAEKAKKVSEKKVSENANVETVSAKASQTCLICFEDSSDYADLKCHHYFCKDCLGDIFTAKWSSARISFNYLKCPACREPFEDLVDQSDQWFQAQLSEAKLLQKQVEKITIEAYTKYLNEEWELVQKAKASTEPAADEKENSHNNKNQNTDEDNSHDNNDIAGKDASAGGDHANTDAVKNDEKTEPATVEAEATVEKTNVDKEEEEKKPVTLGGVSLTEMSEIDFEESIKTISFQEASKIMAIYMCVECSTPYSGGRVSCAEDLEIDVSQLRCHSCTWHKLAHAEDRRCMEHGYPYAIFKCDACCNVAVWDCVYNHFCDRCHETACQDHDFPCPGIDDCPLGFPHPKNKKANHGEATSDNFIVPFVIGCYKCIGADIKSDVGGIPEGMKAVFKDGSSPVFEEGKQSNDDDAEKNKSKAKEENEIVDLHFDIDR